MILGRLLGVRSLLSASTLAVAGAGAWVFWPAAPPLPADVSVDVLKDRFEGRVVLVPNDSPGSNMRLGEEFAYVDPSGKRWVAAADLETDGASIPAVLYPVVGHPFDGAYLKAAIVHDAACPSEVDNWRDAHLMFYHALRRCGLGETKSKIMYAAVYHFGPRWADPAQPTVTTTSPFEGNIVGRKLAAIESDAQTEKPGDAAPPRVAEIRYDETRRAITTGSADPAAEEQVRKELFEKCRAWIEREDPTLAEIEDWTAGMGEAP